MDKTFKHVITEEKVSAYDIGRSIRREVLIEISRENEIELDIDSELDLMERSEIIDTGLSYLLNNDSYIEV